MLRRLFKSRSPLNHADPAVRRSAIRQLDDAAAENLAEELARMLREDPDREVRLACLVHVRDRALLESLVTDPDLGEAASQRLRALAHGAGPPASDPDPTGPDPVRPEQWLALPEAEAAARIRALDDPEALVTLALKARGTLRDVVLEHSLLTRPATLTILEKRSRDHDKSLNRHARKRLEHWRGRQHEAQVLQSRAEELSAALQRRHTGAQDQAWRERQHQLHERLEQTLDAYRAVRDELGAVGETLPDLEHLRSDPADLPPLQAEPAEEPAPPEAAPDADGELTTAADEDPFEALVQGFRRLDEALGSGGSFAEIAAERQRLTDRWLTAADHRPPTETQHAVFESVSHRFRELADAMDRLASADLPELPETALEIGPPEDVAAHRALWDAVEQRRRLVRRLEQTRRTVRWPQWAPPTAEYARILAAMDELKTELARADEVLAAELAKLDEQLDALAAAIDEGHLTSARTLLGHARTLHDALPAAAVRRQGKALGKQAARLAELKDWQTFATTPKREALLQEMQALAAAPLEPREQAERIKKLRREWQALGPITQAADGRLADRFNAEAEKAFEPCRSYFAEQAQVRKANLAERRRICDQLEQYLDETDWAQADMKAAERIMRAARDEWRRFHPVDRNPGKAVEARFEQLQGRLHDLVKAEWDRNLAAKEAIVREAEALADADQPLRDKVEAAKRLQRRWQEVGITPRRPDQRLWRQFRSACDRIFSAREESRQAADAALDEATARVRARLDAFAAALETLAPEQASAAELRRLKQETAELDSLPANRRRPLTELRAELIRRYGRLLDEQERAGRRERLFALARWDEAMTALETGGAGEPPTPPAGFDDLPGERRGRAGEPAPLDAARRLTIKAELAAGRESASEDETLRLEVQVERLQAGLTGAASGEDPFTLAADWCRLGPKDERFAPLRERLFAALGDLF
ncbi:MAG TPA: DUF349 domain-containing protein [Pseudomonadales bacterium]